MILGPRQVGKSFVLLRCRNGERQYINLDDVATRIRAQENPKLFARELTPPLIIDEIQYAPQFLSAIKMLADRYNVYGNIVRFFRHRSKEIQVHFWRTRDGQEIDFLVETASGVLPVEVKLGIPRQGALPPLVSIRDAHWREGAVVSLAHLGPDSPSISADWRLCAIKSLADVLAAC